MYNINQRDSFEKLQDFLSELLKSNHEEIVKILFGNRLDNEKEEAEKFMNYYKFSLILKHQQRLERKCRNSRVKLNMTGFRQCLKVISLKIIQKLQNEFPANLKQNTNKSDQPIQEVISLSQKPNLIAILEQLRKSSCNKNNVVVFKFVNYKYILQLITLMIKALFAAEFDLVKGCVITACYPPINHQGFHELASYMIPDGVHKIQQDKFFFRIGNIRFIPGQVYTYHFDYRWNQLLQSSIQTLSYSDENVIKIRGEKESEWLDINLINAQVQVISHDFVSITLNPDLIYGIKGKFTQDYYLTCLKNKKDVTIKRGSLIRSISICTSDLLFLGICNLKIEKYLEEYFLQVGLDHWINDVDTNSETIQKILEKGFNELSSDLTYYKFSHSLLDYSFKDLGNLYPKRAYSLTTNASLLNLFKMLDMKIRILYRALLQQQRIIFLCHEYNNQEKYIGDDMYFNVCNLVLSLCFLVSPLNIIYNIQGYKSLLDKGWEQQNSWISIVSNPIFEYRKEWWDILIDINSGKIIESKKEQSLFINNQTDIDFFQNLINLIQVSHINEFQIRSILQKYTSSIIENLPQTLLFKGYRKMKIKNLLNEQQYAQILNILAIIKLQKTMKDQELFQMYVNLLDCLKTELQFKEFFKLFTESNYELNTFGIGTMCQDVLVQEKCREFLKLIEKWDKQLMQQINLFLVI
ncbi:unnamed protein product [Paramecium sonneborni]|uniref:Arf3-interacting protein 1 N-terminal domain-containing protein n=1 Tax=Paramecium sonneborni TaxID=65129 RepID=A0A8S1R627_9CILI|nr:unnamed protein product [Paramecium sonneborni]